MKRKIIGIFLSVLIIAATVQVTGLSLRYFRSIEDQKNIVDYNGFYLKDFFDVGVGIPTNIINGENRNLGENNFFVTVQNNGDLSASVNLDFFLELYDGNDWAEVDSSGTGPYDLDPEAWVESFFDVVFDTEGAYRATFSLDTPRPLSDWSDDNPENDVYQVVFIVIDPSSTSEWYVDDDASPGGDGSKEHPFQTITEAIIIADPSDKIWIIDGIYDEQLIIDKEYLDISSIYKSPFCDDQKTVLEWDSASIVIINKPFTRLTGFVIKNCGTGEEDAAVDITSDYNFISWNILEDNGATGIYLHDSSNNNYIHHNVIQNNGGAGMFIWQQSKNNWMYHNDFINNNWYNVKDKEGGNIWNYIYPYGGNYWDDYEGLDTNGDGIGEIPYEIMGDFVPTGLDEGPWVEPHKWNDHDVIKKIDGPSTGKPDDKYEFEFTLASENFGPGSDPFTEPAVCRVDWGDGSEEKIGPLYPDTIAKISHVWSNSGKYTIRAKITDGYGLESDEVTLKLTIPRSKTSIYNHIWFLFSRYSNFLPILKILLH